MNDPSARQFLRVMSSCSAAARSAGSSRRARIASIEFSSPGFTVLT
jgi:hypothetical protein